jgi:HAE1 family hydrophobic/amphiphilic exporter-1
MTISLVAVFIPVLFMGGIVGRLLHEFSVTIVVAILISGVVSLSMTPMLGSRFLRHNAGHRHGRAYRALERGFELMTSWYEYSLRIALRFRLATLAVAVLMFIGTAYLFVTMPTGFIPAQDSGFFFAQTLGPQDISFESMAKHHRAISETVRAQPYVQRVGSFVQGGNQAFFFAIMKPRDERTVSVDEAIEDLRPKVAAVPGLLTFMQNPPPVTVSVDPTPPLARLPLVELSSTWSESPSVGERMTGQVLIGSSENDSWRALTSNVPTPGDAGA